MDEERTGTAEAELEAAIAEAGGFKGPGADAPVEQAESDAPVEPEGVEETPKEEVKEEAGDPLDQPLTDFADLDLGLGEDFPVGPETLESFGKVAVESGLTARQVQAIAKWQVEEIGRARERMVKAGLEELAREWGNEAGAKQKQLNELIGRVDKLAGNDSFSRAISESGADCYAGFARGLLALTALLAEDSIGTKADAPAGPLKESALDGLEAVFAQARK